MEISESREIPVNILNNYKVKSFAFIYFPSLL